MITAAELVRSGQVSARDLIQTCLDRIAVADEALNAFVHLDRRRTRGGRSRRLGPTGGTGWAARRGAVRREGPRGLRRNAHHSRITLVRRRLHPPTATTSTSPASAPPERSPSARPPTPEFGAFGYTASPLHGVTRNPWNTERTPGGSSGGTAASVAAGAIPFGTASDGGGSIRGPAASCGLPGLKPTYGRIPTFGVTRHAQNAVNFALATTIADTALLFDLAVGPDIARPHVGPAPGLSYAAAIDDLDVAGLRAAWSADLGFVTMDPEVESITHRASDTLIDAAGMVDTGVNVRIDDFIRIYAFMESADQFVDVPADWEDRLDELDPLVVGGWRRNKDVTLPQFAKVEAARQGLEMQVAALFDDIDVLITPTNPCPPFAAEGPMPTTIGGQRCHAGTAALLTMFANVANLPAITVPAGLTADGLPIGLMITAATPPRRHLPAPRAHLRAALAVASTAPAGPDR